MNEDYSLEMLLGAHLVSIGRCTDLIWWIFRKGQSEYSLHTQCSCRVMQDGYPVLTRSSIYYGKDDDPESKITLFDVIVAEEVNGLLPLTVNEIKRTNVNDVYITMDKGISIEVFADQPVGHEQWRLFSQGQDQAHLVAYSDRLDYE